MQDICTFCPSMIHGISRKRKKLCYQERANVLKVPTLFMVTKTTITNMLFHDIRLRPKPKLLIINRTTQIASVCIQVLVRLDVVLWETWRWQILQESSSLERNQTGLDLKTSKGLQHQHNVDSQNQKHHSCPNSYPPA